MNLKIIPVSSIHSLLPGTRLHPEAAGRIGHQAHTGLQVQAQRMMLVK
ncbi:MAG: hypothetical protein Q8M01_19030 [Rubrivivax sp.]|nr:hypothetical protein [Rubrivivax sp.]